MTIETRVETAPSAKAGGFRYVASDRVAVVSITGERDTPTTALRVVLEACAARFEGLLRAWLGALPDDHLFLFAATPPSHQPNVVTRRRGIWGVDGLRWLPASGPRSPSVEVGGPGGAERFAGIAEVPEAHVFEAADFARTHDGSFLFVSPRVDPSEERVRAMVGKVFPKGESALDWASVVALLDGDAGEHICIRASGGFDDREASIDAFLSEELRRRLPRVGDAPEP